MQTVDASAIVETYIEIGRSRKPGRRLSPKPLANAAPRPFAPRRERLISWIDLPEIYGATGYDAGRLSGSDKATLFYLYRDMGIRFIPNNETTYVRLS